MAIDYGSKRVGIAVTDELQLIANGLTTVHSADLFDFLTNYFEKENVEEVVVGEPKRLNNTPSQSAELVNAFIKQFKKKFPNIKLSSIDERYTSKIAQKTILSAGAKKKQRQNKALVDQVSATIILQSYMDLKENGLI